ncbi:MAG: pyrroline-5-carboxylate reductase [Bacteroidales bacterium]|nr:pyrroline-5-carboxylate reductase [Bacteroidales bacterium]
MKITVIGAGNMGGALIKGWAKKGTHELTITARTEETLARYKKEYPAIKTSLNNAEAVVGAEVIVLAVKPWLVEDVIGQIRDMIDFEHQIILSVAANVFTETLREQLNCPKAQTLYVMPNIAAEYGESMTYLAPATGIPNNITDTVRDLLLEVGKVKVCKESQVAAGNMLSGCGIAYVMRFIHAMMEGGVEMGLYPSEAQEIAMQAMKGAVAVLEGAKMHPAVGIDKVTTPGGLTIRGLNELDHAGFNSAVIKCLKAGLVK